MTIKKIPQHKKTEPTQSALSDSTPTTEPVKTLFPIVGIGASAGGLAAFEAFFSGMPSHHEPNMAFVLVQHLAPDHKSMLTELIQRQTRMQVFEVEDGMQVSINCAYIIPPNYDMAYLNGKLHLFEPSAPRGMRLPIDFFFRSLAQDQHENAIGIVLSGTGSDGSNGVLAIKAEGGMVMVQKPESTEFNGMPLNAIATGLVDYELLPADMPSKLIAYVEHLLGTLPKAAGTHLMQNNVAALKKIFILLRNETGHDFSQYKPSTIHRRIERRMVVHQIVSVDDYVKYLQQNPAEVTSLFRDMLIGVTNFFRDTDAFRVLEKLVIPKLFDGKPAGSVIRVWSVGCSTGEEAYSVAILLQEHIESLKQSYTVQVFATDIDSRAIAIARAGVYPATIATHVTPERLARYFILQADTNTYRIQPTIRDMLIFSEQDLIKDPPFSKIDLLCCRNLLIYISAELQKSIIPLFHFVLKPNGMMFLGTSEGIGDFAHLFTTIDQKSKIYQRKEYYLGTNQGSMTRFLPFTKHTDVSPKQANIGADLTPNLLPLRELTEQILLRQVTPPSVLVNSEGDILYLHGKTGRYLELSAGVTGVNNILKMARGGLQHPLAKALKEAAETKETVHSNRLQIKMYGDIGFVNLTICYVKTKSNLSDVDLYLVVFQDVTTSVTERLSTKAEPTEDTQLIDAEVQLEELRQELRIKDEYLQTTYEKLETSNEELKSSNEEMQSVNEELQSTNEELETSKEELQSVNEELATVNNELQTKVVDLSHANNDMNNLLAGTGIGTIFVDHQLNILRFTPAASKIINLIASDVGRSITHIVHNLLAYHHLAADIQSVLNDLVPKEIEVQIKDNEWYMMRIQPYRTLNNSVEGAVISFFNITETVQARNSLLKANDMLRLAIVVRDAYDAITVLAMNGAILAWNPGAVRAYGWSEAEALGMNVLEMIPQNLREEALVKLHKLSQAKVLEPYLTNRYTKTGTVLEVSIISTALLNESGVVYAIATTERIVDGDEK